MKKLAAALTIAAALFGTAGAATAPESAPKKLAPFFYEFTSGDYSPAKALQLLEKGPAPKPAGRCSGFRSGDFHGRNLDWNIDRTNYYFVRTPEKAGRFATIGIAQDFGNGDLELIPVAMMDGINSQGVVVEVNVVPAGDRGITTATKPGAPRMGILMVTRHLLDHAKSAAHAVQLFDTVDLFGDGQHEMHWMISDLKETYVVEIVNNRIKSVKHPIMTNFYVTESPYVKPDGVFTPGSAGIERYERLKRHLGKIDSVGAMLAAMKEEWYTLVYTPGRELDWWSEFNDYQWTDPDTGKKWHFKYAAGDKEDAKCESHLARLKCMRATQKDFAAMRAEEKATGVRKDTIFWQTVDSGCYDIRNRRLSIRMQENEPLFEFALDGEPAPAVERIGDWRLRVDGCELDVQPAALVQVKGEKMGPLPEKPQGGWKCGGWQRGKRLTALIAYECSVQGALLPETVVVKAADGTRLAEGRDYEVEKDWGCVSRLAGGRLGAQDPVTVDYTYRPQRLDRIVRTKSGAIKLRQGAVKASNPVLPASEPGEVTRATVWLDGRTVKLEARNVYPVFEQDYPTPPAANVCTAARLLPKTWTKLAKGEPVTVLAWGDSVTDGGYLPEPDRWQSQFVARLRAQFPKNEIRLINNGWGGRNTDSFFSAPPGHRFNYEASVLNSKADLVVLEFVNDSWLTNYGPFKERYDRILRDLKGRGAELCVLTPHYVRADWMGLPDPTATTEDPRHYVKNLRRWTAENGVALADASLRWGRFARQGIPYQTLLTNEINHPNKQGMKTFADALMELFDQSAHVYGTVAKADELVGLHPGFAKAFQFLKRADLVKLPAGKYEIDGGNAWAMVQDCSLRPFAESNTYETHGEFIDIQMPLSGAETIGIARTPAAKVGEIDAAKDCALWKEKGEAHVFQPGEFAIFFPPYGAHAPGLTQEAPHRHRKLVIKVRK